MLALNSLFSSYFPRIFRPIFIHMHFISMGYKVLKADYCELYSIIFISQTTFIIFRWGKREQALLRPVRATPLRWGKRSVDSQLYELLNKHEDEEPLEKRVPLDELLNKPEADWEKRAPLRWGKRAPARFGKRAPARFGKRAPSRYAF